MSRKIVLTTVNVYFTLLCVIGLFLGLFGPMINRKVIEMTFKDQFMLIILNSFSMFLFVVSFIGIMVMLYKSYLVLSYG